jgi:hypothetical protein
MFSIFINVVDNVSDVDAGRNETFALLNDGTIKLMILLLVSSSCSLPFTYSLSK